MSRAQETARGGSFAAQKAKNMREHDREARAALRRLVRDIKQAIRDRKVQAKREGRASIDRCKADRLTLAERIKAAKIQVRQALKEQIAAERQAARNECALRKERIKSLGMSEVDTKRALLAAARYDVQAEKIANRNVNARLKGQHKSSYAERVAEARDAVEKNIPPELISAYRKRRNTYTGGGLKSATEGFMEWSATSEGKREIMGEAQKRADREVAQLIKQQRDAERELRKVHPKAPATSAASRTLAITGTGGMDDYRLIPSPRRDAPAREVKRDPGRSLPGIYAPF